MITIENLTAKQRALISVMWDLDSMAKVQQFIRTLSPSDARDAHGLLQIVIWESIEQEDGLDAYKDHSDACIRAARGL